MAANNNRSVAIDWGNTRLKVGVFEHGILQKVAHLLDAQSLYDFVHQAGALKAVLMATQNLTPEILPTLQSILPTLHVESNTPLPIGNLYETPHTLGTDRLAAAVGAWAMYSKTACLIIDAGTCITLDFLNAEGVFEGGNITLGLAMRFKALHTFTAKLPLVGTNDFVKNTITGNNTRQAIYNGVLNGIVAELAYTIEAYRHIHPTIKVLLCGGDADFLATLLKYPTTVQAHLSLIGLYYILNFSSSS